MAKTGKLKRRVTADNVPPELMMRLVGTQERDMTSESHLVRKALDESLPPLARVKKHFNRAVRKGGVK